MGVALTTAGALVGSGAMAQETATPDYRFMVLKASKQSVQATLGAYCHPNSTAAENCSVVPRYPLKTTGTLRLRRGTTVTMLFRADAGNVTWRAARIDGRGREQLTATGVAKLVTTKSKRRWKLTLPKRLSRSTDLLGFDVQYPNAYSSFEVGLRVR
ncbi:MAG: hypothetical protein JWO90_1287 [Solirubrobacterales bacterium]|nr:hypothetical protein [Solirubrobacterales bacterium]